MIANTHYFDAERAKELLEKGIKVEDAAEEFGMQTRYFYAHFRDHFGVPPSYYQPRAERKRAKKFDIKKIVLSLSLHGRPNTDKPEEISFYREFRRATGFKISEYPLLPIQSNGNTVTLSPTNIRAYLEEYGLKSMDEDYGYLENEIRLALRNINTGTQEPLTRVVSDNMYFVFGRKMDGLYVIKELGILT